MWENLNPAAGPAVATDELAPFLAGQVGQATLGRLAGLAHPELDQHMAAVAAAARDVLGARHEDPAQMLAFLVRYATGFTAAATSGGWQPARATEPIDWESMRLAGVCQLVAVLMTQG